MAKSRENLDLILLELLPRAATVPLLATPKILVDRPPVEDQAGRQPGQDRDQSRPVRLACSCQPQHQAERTAARMTSTGAGDPVQRSNEAAP